MCLHFNGSLTRKAYALTCKHVQARSLTNHEVRDDGERNERYESHRYEVAEHFAEEISGNSIEAASILVSTYTVGNGW